MREIAEIFYKATSEDISLYAFDDISEFISECIAEGLTKKSRITAKQVMSIILGVDWIDRSFWKVYEVFTFRWNKTQKVE